MGEGMKRAHRAARRSREATPEEVADLARRVKIVKEAVIAATENDDSGDVRHAGRVLASSASSATLAHLGRLLK